MTNSIMLVTSAKIVNKKANLDLKANNIENNNKNCNTIINKQDIIRSEKIFHETSSKHIFENSANLEHRALTTFLLRGVLMFKSSSTVLTR